jgi:hypothetical protein
MSMHVKDPTPTATEALIPEAREHQRRRYVWTGAVAALAAVVLAGLIAGAVVLFSGSTAGSRSPQPAASVALVRPSHYVYFRPVLCSAPAYSPAATSGAAPAASATCSPASQFTTSNLAVNPAGHGPDGFSSTTPPTDAALAHVPSTRPAEDVPSATVLLPSTDGTSQYGGPRLLLGPAEMTNASIGSAVVHRFEGRQWVVDYTMKPSTSALWDSVAYHNFHQLVGVDLDGTVVSAPFIQPTQTSFSSFDGHGEISANHLTRAGAVALARTLESHRK